MSGTCTVRRSRAARAEMLWRPGAIGFLSTNSLSSGDTLYDAAERRSLPSNRKRNALSASHNLTAFSTSVSKMGCSSNAVRLMTLSTSAVAVCCWRDSRSSLRRRVFSMAMTAWAAKDSMSATCLSLNEATSRCMVPITPITVPSRTNGVEICELYPKSRADCSVIGGASGLPTMGAICSVRPASIALPTWVRASSGTGRRSASFSKPGSPLSPATSIMPSRSRPTKAKLEPNRRSRLRTIVSNTGWVSVVEPLIEDRISPVAVCCSRASERCPCASASSRVRASSCFFNSISELGPLLTLAFVPVERSLRPRVGLFAPSRVKVTSSAQSLVPLSVGPSSLSILTEPRDEPRLLFDHLVGAREQHRRDIEPQRLRDLEVDDQLELGRLQYRQIGWPGPFENSCRVNANLAVGIYGVYSIAHQAASCSIFTELINRRKHIVRRQNHKLTAPGIEEWIGRKDERCGLLLNHRPKGGVDLIIRARMKHINLQAERLRCLSHVVQLALSRCKFRVIEEGDGFRLRHQFVQQPETLGLHVSGLKIYPGGIPAGPIVAPHQTGLDRISTGRKHDRDGRSRGFCCQRRRFATSCSHNRHRQTRELRCPLRQTIILAERPTQCDYH